MALACNIDERGRTYRYRIGYALLGLGIGLGLALAQWWSVRVGLLSGGLLAAGGAFAVFEARNSWCAVRALGFKTRV